MVNVQVRGEMSPERRAALSFTGAGNISETEQTGKIEISLTLRDALILELTTQQWNNDLPLDIRERAGTAADFLAKYVQTVTPSEVLTLTAMREGITIEFTLFEQVESIAEQCQAVFREQPVQWAMLKIYGLLGAFLKTQSPPQQAKQKTELVPKNTFPLPTRIIKGYTYAPPLPGIEVNTANSLAKVGHFKMEHVLLSLLSKTSEGDPAKEGYFLGNMPQSLAAPPLAISKHGQAEPMPEQPVTKITMQDICREWGGGKKLGATDKKYIFKILSEYEALQFDMFFESDNGDGTKTMYSTKAARAQIVRVSVGSPEQLQKVKSGDTGATLDTTGDIIVIFNPAFLAYNGKYSKTPENLPQILETCAGGAKHVTDTHYRLWHYFASLAGTTQKTTIYEDNLMKKAGIAGSLRNQKRDKKNLLKVLSDLQKAGLLGEVSHDSSGKFTITLKGGMRDEKRGDA